MDNVLKFNLYRGKVISIEDETKTGKVQVKLLPEMKDISDDKCPWFPPLKGNSSDNELCNFDVPEVGSLIFVLADSLFYHRYYTNFKYDIQGKFDYSKVEDLLGGVDVDTEYKNVQFQLFQDGSILFHNRMDGSHGFIQSTGSSVVVNKDGEIICQGQEDSKVSILKNGDIDITSKNLISNSENITINGKAIDIDGDSIHLNGDSKSFVTYTELDTALQTFKTSIETSISATITASIPLHTHNCTAPGAPSGPGLGSSSPTVPTTLDISPSKTTTVKTGG